MKHTYAILLLGVLSTFVAGAAQSPPIDSGLAAFSGAWRVDGEGGSLPWTLILRVEDGEVVGSVSRCANSRATIYDVRVKGNTIAFKCQNEGASRTVSFEGHREGDRIAFTWDLRLAPGAVPVGEANRMFGPLAPRSVVAVRLDDSTAEAMGATPIAADELAEAVNLRDRGVKLIGTIFLPRAVTRARAVIVTMSYGRGVNFYAASSVRHMVERTQSALLLVNISAISSDTLGVSFADRGGDDALAMVLRRLAGTTGHQELSAAPLLFWGHSGGAVFGSAFAQAHPDRTIAFVGYQGDGAGTPNYEVLRRIPALLFADGSGNIDGTYFWAAGRSLGAPWTFAMQREAPHGDLDYLARAHALTIPWIEAVLRLRLPRSGTVLASVNDDGGWLGTNRTGEVTPRAMFPGPPRSTSWIPDEASARAWQSVVADAR